MSRMTEIVAAMMIIPLRLPPPASMAFRRRDNWLFLRIRARRASMIDNCTGRTLASYVDSRCRGGKQPELFVRTES